RARRPLAAALLAAVGAAAAGLAIQRVAIAGSISGGGRSLSDVSRYSANVVDFLARHPTHGAERFVYLGLATPLLAFAGWRVVGVLFADLDTRVYSITDADPANAAYAAIARQPSGRVLELPIFTPDVHYGSVYMYYGTQAERQRPLGYSTLAPRSVETLVRRL